MATSHDEMSSLRLRADRSRKLGNTEAECSGPYLVSVETHQLNSSGKPALWDERGR